MRFELSFAGRCQLPEESCVCLGYAPIHCAAQAGSAECVRLLLAARADVSSQSGHVHFNIASAIEGDHEARRRMREGCPQTAVAVDGFTALHVAIACGNLEVTRGSEKG
eukprot:Skav233019  [mRNA]  locus=scaffold909:269553:276046:+ [translate_table: standard]